MALVAERIHPVQETIQALKKAISILPRIPTTCAFSLHTTERGIVELDIACFSLEDLASVAEAVSNLGSFRLFDGDYRLMDYALVVIFYLWKAEHDVP